MARKVKVGIVGMGQGGVSIYKTLRSIEYIEICVVCDRLENAKGIQMAQIDGVQTCVLLDDYFKASNLDVIIEATGDFQVQQQIEQAKQKSCTVIEAQGANLMLYIIEEKEKL